MDRRSLIMHAGIAGVLAAGAAPAVHAQAAIRWRLASSFPKALDTIYGAAEVFAQKVSDMSGGKFSIGVMKTDGSGERILTTGFHNEGPTWAPNGRVLMFFRQNAGAGGPQLYSIDLTGYNEQLVKTPSFASDPAWSPLME